MSIKTVVVVPVLVGMVISFIALLVCVCVERLGALLVFGHSLYGSDPGYRLSLAEAVCAH